MPYDYGRHFGEITLTQDLTTLPHERTWRLTAPEREPERHEIVLYLGCNVLRTSHMLRTITAIFDRLGLDYVAVGGPTYCCGIVHHRNGDTAASTGMNRRTVDLFQRYRPAEVVMWCPSCIYFYDEVQKFEWPFPTRHATEFLASRLSQLTFTHRVDARVALHFHSQSEARLRDEIERARAGGAAILATIYHGCQRLICGFESEGRIAIEHYLSVFARALGIEFEDRFKKYRLWQDPERVLAESTPCQQANHVDPARARELVVGAFGRYSAPPDGGNAAAS